VGGLAHFIERAGVASTSISLIREHTQMLRPPRALWVTFPLGRPLGIPGDAPFQTRVLKATLSLLETATSPVIEDYPEDAPADPAPEKWVCPVNFPMPNAGSLEARLHAELAQLAPWAGQTRVKRGRTLLGASGGGVDDVEAMASILCAVADGAPLDSIPSAQTNVSWWHPMPFLMRHLADDLRIMYHEAVAAQPGDTPSHAALTHWIFTSMVLGEVLTKVGEQITAMGDRRLLTLRGYLIPEGYVEGDESFGRRQPDDPPGFLRALAGNKYLRGEAE
jgi:hypothetical protein